MVDVVRAKHDSKQHSIIPAHATLCRDEEVDQWDIISPRINAIEQIEVDFTLGDPELDDGGVIFLPILDGKQAFDDLRTELLGPIYKQGFPHITIVHPRNVVATPDMLAEIRASALPDRVVLTEVVLIEQIDGGVWNTLESFPS